MDERNALVRYGGLKNLPDLTREVLRMENQLGYLTKQLRTQQDRVHVLRAKETLLQAQISNLKSALEKAPTPDNGMIYQEYVRWYKTQRAHALDTIVK